MFVSNLMPSLPTHSDPPGPPTSIEDQIYRLAQRGMSISDPQKAFRFLSNVSYYRFRGYLTPFVDPAASASLRTFRTNTTFDTVVERYEFDARLRSLVLQAFNKIEVSLRAQWTYHLSYTHGGGEFAHLDPTFFSSDHGKNLAEIKLDYQRHGRAYHSYDFPSCPTWAIAEVMSFGQLSRWYRDSIQQIQRLVAHHYGLHENLLRPLLHHLTLVRNFCAHHELLWDRKLNIKIKVPKKLGAYDKSARFFNAYDTARIYNTLVIAAYLTGTISGSAEWSGLLVDLMNTYPEIPQSEMGFIPDWQELAIWQE